MDPVKNINGWTVQSGMPDDFIRLCCAKPDDRPAGFEQIARSHNRTLVCRFNYAGKSYYYKEYFFPGLYKLLKDMLRGFWNERAARVHTQLEQAGFSVAHVSAIGAKGWQRFMVTEEVSGEPLRNFRRKLSRPEKAILMNQYGEMIGRLHQCGFSHGDLRWGNILVSQKNGQYEFVLIDNERTVKHRSGIPQRLCIKNLVHTRYSGVSEGMDEAEWLVFFNAYCDAFSRVGRSRVRWETKLARKLKQRIGRGNKKSERMANEVR